MPRLTIVASKEQLEQVGKLVDKSGVGVYRDIKAKAGAGRMKPFSSLTRLEADTVIEMLKVELKANI